MYANGEYYFDVITVAGEEDGTCTYDEASWSDDNIMDYTLGTPIPFQNEDHPTETCIAEIYFYATDGTYFPASGEFTFEVYIGGGKALVTATANLAVLFAIMYV
mmetsp:Transcript_8225/g.7637  ORF Transcript_8225/g.7637 Transcript_8225/m.7637 type:complete len:104 (+) Transcript_8225:309-620(+)